MIKETTAVGLCLAGIFVSTGASAQILTDEPAPPPAPSVAPRPAPQPVPVAPQPVPVAPQPAPVAPQPAPHVAPPAPLPLPQPAPAPAAPPAPTPAAASAAASTPAPEAPPGGPSSIDHDLFVGHLGVGYMGISQLPIAAGPGAAGVINAPVIGARYWLRRDFGIDGGIGFAASSGTIDAAGTSTDKPGQIGFAIHGGAPINIAYGKHYAFQIVPELNLGFSSATIKGTPDVSLSGFRFDIGARAGAEIHFGFIGVPELALQASIGLYINHTSRSSTPSGGQASGESTTTIATSVQSDPWALFANNISALYYF